MLVGRGQAALARGSSVGASAPRRLAFALRRARIDIKQNVNVVEHDLALIRDGLSIEPERCFFVRTTWFFARNTDSRSWLLALISGSS
jgi:hypothetical protein